jgi:hypothetical protein
MNKDFSNQQSSIPACRQAGSISNQNLPSKFNIPCSTPACRQAGSIFKCNNAAINHYINTSLTKKGPNTVGSFYMN